MEPAAANLMDEGDPTPGDWRLVQRADLQFWYDWSAG